MLIKSKDGFGIVGRWRGFQTELDFEKDPETGLYTIPVDTGVIVPGSQIEDQNTITTTMKAYLMNKMVDDASNDYALDSLFAVEGLVAGNNTKGGIAGVASVTNDACAAGDVEEIFLTTLNAGGDNTEVYFELYGYITGVQAISDYLAIIQNYLNADDSATYVLAYSAISPISVSANRRYHHYWKVLAA